MPPDYTASQFDINNCFSHFMGCVPISLNNCVAIEAAYMVEAIILVKSMGTMKKAEIAAATRDKYKAVIDALPLSCFAYASLKVKIAEKYFRAKSNSPEVFLTKATDVLKKCQGNGGRNQGDWNSVASNPKWKKSHQHEESVHP